MTSEGERLHTRRKSEKKRRQNGHTARAIGSGGYPPCTKKQSSKNRQLRSQTAPNLERVAKSPIRASLSANSPSTHTLRLFYSPLSQSRASSFPTPASKHWIASALSLLLRLSLVLAACQSAACILLAREGGIDLKLCAVRVDFGARAALELKKKNNRNTETTPCESV